jgi:UDP-glucose 4-epimerase
MSVLVTGGAGFLGGHLARALRDAGREVVVLDDLSGGLRQNVPEGVELVTGNVCDEALVGRLFSERRFEVVFHLAAYAAEGLSHFIRRFNYTNNVVGSVTLINEAVRHGVKRFVFTSSIAVYGAGELPLRECHVPRPEDPYGIAKLAVEQDLAAAHRQFGLEYTIFRPHNLYGELQSMRDRYRNVVGIFLNQAMQGRPLTIFGDGRQTRAFTYVGDVIPAMAASGWHEGARNQVFNAGGDRAYEVAELARAVLEVTGAEVDVQHLPARNEVAHAYSDHSRLYEVFGRPDETPLELGLARTWAWAQGVGPSETPPFAAIELEDGLPPSWRG